MFDGVVLLVGSYEEDRELVELTELRPPPQVILRGRGTTPEAAKCLAGFLESASDMVRRGAKGFSMSYARYAQQLPLLAVDAWRLPPFCLSPAFSRLQQRLRWAGFCCRRGFLYLIGCSVLTGAPQQHKANHCICTRNRLLEQSIAACMRAQDYTGAKGPAKSLWGHIEQALQADADNVDLNALSIR